MVRARAVLAAAVLIWGAAATTTARPAEDPAVAVADLVARLGDAAKRAEAAAELVRRGAAAVPDLLPALQDTTLRAPALDVIARIGPAAKQAVPSLVPLVRNPVLRERAAVARALGALGAEGLPAAAALLSYVGEPGSAGRDAAADALARIVVADAERRRSPSPPGPSDQAVAAGCDWLVRHQSAEGGWSCALFDGRCAGARCGGPGLPEHDVGVTGLATLALLGAGRARSDPRTVEATRSALGAIAAGRDEQGLLARTQLQKWAYGHHIAALALVDGLRLTGDEGLRPAATAAVRATAEAQNPYLAWRYGIRDGDNDTSVTTWATAVLAAAQRSGIAVFEGWEGGALAWVEKMTDPESGRVGYQQRGGQVARNGRVVSAFPPGRSESLTACGLRIRLDVGAAAASYDEVAKGLGRLLARRPKWDPGEGDIDLYYWAHGSEVMGRVGGSAFRSWREALLAALPPHQRTDPKSCDRGSWDPCDPWSGDGGRVYATAMALLALEPCTDDRSKWPPLGPTANSAIQVLERAAKSGDDAVRRAASFAADRIRAAHSP